MEGRKRVRKILKEAMGGERQDGCMGVGGMWRMWEKERERALH